MDQVIVVREVVLVMGEHLQGIRRLVVVGEFPVALEYLAEPFDDGRVVDDDAEDISIGMMVFGEATGLIEDVRFEVIEEASAR